MLLTGLASAQPRNLDESKVGPYTLPSLLVFSDGTSISTRQQWEKQRRPEILDLFSTHVYGRTPATTAAVKREVYDVKQRALDGLATRKLVRITLPDHPQWQGIDMALYIPNHAKGPVPVFIGLSFMGNHAVTTETDILISTRWMRPSPDLGIVDNRATAASRGVMVKRWPLHEILNRGYAVATAYYGDIEPDKPDGSGWREGVRVALSPDGLQTQWKHDDWAAIGAWAWGLSRMLDYCETDQQLDAKRAIVIGHSRLGKTALWAGAQDTRSAIVISNDSGEAGAALNRRNYGETNKVLAVIRPYWFCPNYSTYADRVDDLPVDQHMLIALMAPRPAYIASATKDNNADPLGEFLAAVHAEPAYQLYGLRALGTTTYPHADMPVGDQVKYHTRTGKHDITSYDWGQYMDFADRQFDAHHKR